MKDIPFQMSIIIWHIDVVTTRERLFAKVAFIISMGKNKTKKKTFQWVVHNTDIVSPKVLRLLKISLTLATR